MCFSQWRNKSEYEHSTSFLCEETQIISDLRPWCSVKNKKMIAKDNQTVTCEWRDFVARTNSRWRQISRDAFALFNACSSNNLCLKIKVKKFKISISFLYFYSVSPECVWGTAFDIQILLLLFYEGREGRLEAREKQRIWSIVPQNALPAGRCILQSNIAAVLSIFCFVISAYQEFFLWCFFF